MLTLADKAADYKAKLAHAFDEGFTQSEMSVMDECGKRWQYNYFDQLTKAGSFSWALIVGTAFHVVMEQMYATRGERWAVPEWEYPPGTIMSGNDEVMSVYWKHVLPAMLQAYSGRYRDDFERFVIPDDGIELDITVTFEDIKFRGKVDMVFKPSEKDGWFIMDHKTTSRLDRGIVAGWDFRFQFMFYLWLAWKAMPKYAFKGYFINAIKKPELRPKKGEVITEFADRVRMDMVTDPEKYYYRDKLIMGPDAMHTFQERVLRPKIERLKILRDHPHESMTWAALFNNMNTGACQTYGVPCPFLELCRHGDDMLYLYERRDHKHQELSGGGDLVT